MYNKLKFIHRKTQSVFFFKFIMIRLLPRHHPAANPSPPFPLCPAAGQRGRSGEGLAEAQLPHTFQDGVSPFAPGISAWVMQVLMMWRMTPPIAGNPVGEVMKLAWPEVTDIKHPRYKNRRYLCPYCTLRVSKSLDLWCAFDRLSNFEEKKQQLEVAATGVSENTDTFLSFPALVFIIAHTLLEARINPWTLEIHIHRLSSPFEHLSGHQSSWSECLPFLAKQNSTLRRTSARTLRRSRAVTALTHSVTTAFSSGRFRGSRL